MIVVTRDKVVRSRVVFLDEPVSQDELNSIRNYINVHLHGSALSDIRLAAQGSAWKKPAPPTILSSAS